MKYKKFGEVKSPIHNYYGDAGVDLFSPVEVVIPPYSISERIPLKIGFEVPLGYCGVVTERSSQGKLGI